MLLLGQHHVAIQGNALYTVKANVVSRMWTEQFNLLAVAVAINVTPVQTLRLCQYQYIHIRNCLPILSISILYHLYSLAPRGRIATTPR